MQRSFPITPFCMNQSRRCEQDRLADHAERFQKNLKPVRTPPSVTSSHHLLERVAATMGHAMLLSIASSKRLEATLYGTRSIMFGNVTKPTNKQRLRIPAQPKMFHFMRNPFRWKHEAAIASFHLPAKSDFHQERGRRLAKLVKTPFCANRNSDPTSISPASQEYNPDTKALRTWEQ